MWYAVERLAASPCWTLEIVPPFVHVHFRKMIRGAEAPVCINVCVRQPCVGTEFCTKSASRNATVDKPATVFRMQAPSTFLHNHQNVVACRSQWSLLQQPLADVALGSAQRIHRETSDNTN